MKSFVLQVLLATFFLTLSFGQLGSISMGSGVTVYIHEILLGCIYMVMLVSVKKSSHTFVVLRPMLVFSLITALSLLCNSFRFLPTEISLSALYIIRWVFYAGLYVVAAGDKKVSRVLLYGLFGSGLMVAIIGVFQFFFYPSLQNLAYLGWDPHLYRVFSTFLDPNFVGIYIILAFILGIYLFPMTVFLWITETFLFLVLVLTYSRSSAVAFCVVSFTYLWTKGKKFVAVGSITLAFSLFIFFPRGGGDTLRPDRLISSVARLENWRWSMSLIAKSPLLGWGFNTLRFIPRPQDHGVKPVDSRAGGGVDNSMLFVGVTTGIVGIIFFGLLIKKLLGLARALSGVGHTSRLGEVLWLSYLAVGIHSLFTNTLFYPWVMVWVWIMTGIGEGALTSGKKSEGSS